MTDDTPGALAWRPQLEMSKRELDDFLSARLVARVATNGAGGFPLVTPLWYFWDGVSIYISTTSNRLAGKNLLRDPRCAILLDIDERGTLGMGTNFAKAVHLLGEAELTPAVPGALVTIDNGPLAGTHEAHHVIGVIGSRYNFQRGQGSVGFTQEELIEQIVNEGGASAEEDGGRMVAKVTPRRIRSWDFSKAPFLR
jgi:hypothetical protein